MISLKGIEKLYLTEAGNHAVLKSVSCDIQTGEFVLIMGRSGSGKSTLLNIITGIDKPTQGEIFINGTNITGFNEGEIAVWRGNNIGIVFQFFQLIPTLTVLENILLPMDLVKKYSAKSRMERAIQLLKKVGVFEHAHKMPNALSGGEQQRVAIARALANDVPIIVADEPTGNLDSKNAEIIFNLFYMLKMEGKTIIIVTHEKDTIQGADRKIILKDGEIIEDLELAAGVKAG